MNLIEIHALEILILDWVVNQFKFKWWWVRVIIKNLWLWGNNWNKMMLMHHYLSFRIPNSSSRHLSSQLLSFRIRCIMITKIMMVVEVVDLIKMAEILISHHVLVQLPYNNDPIHAIKLNNLMRISINKTLSTTSSICIIGKKTWRCLSSHNSNKISESNNICKTLNK